MESVEELSGAGFDEQGQCVGPVATVDAQTDITEPVGRAVFVKFQHRGWSFAFRSLPSPHLPSLPLEVGP